MLSSKGGFTDSVFADSIILKSEKLIYNGNIRKFCKILLSSLEHISENIKFNKEICYLLIIKTIAEILNIKVYLDSKLNLNSLGVYLELKHYKISIEFKSSEIDQILFNIKKLQPLVSIIVDNESKNLKE